ncbi:MAG: carboxypeptidase [Nevskia sp.]|nr:carboxypeptidase [Nevskia sp.]
MSVEHARPQGLRKSVLRALALVALMLAGTAAAKDQADNKPDAADAGKSPQPRAEEQSSQGSVTVEGRHVDYRAVAGTLVVHPKDADDTGADVDALAKDSKDGKEPKLVDLPPAATMSYVAYFKRGDAAAKRPLTFIFNGGPGSSTVWLHMGAFGPRRVVTKDDTHTPAAPYALVNNDYSLLDASDLVFIDAPGTGFGRLYGKDKEKAFWGVDQDAQAFADFVGQFLSKYGRWNSPKYLFGESYGTTRAATLSNILQGDKSIDLNGVILLSQILSFDDSADAPQFNPGIDQAYELALPTYTATAWYHHKLPNAPAALAPLLAEVEQFALNDYTLALAAGSTLDPARKHAIAEKLHQYTGLATDYIEKSELRVNGGQFSKMLQDDAGLTTGRLDTRFSGPSIDPLSREADYDPQSTSISSAYVSAFNAYVRDELKFGQDKTFKPEIDIWRTWNFLHQAPGAPLPLPQSTNVMPDLASAMKLNPNLHVLLNSGYYDLATPFFAAVYELHHLPIPANLQNNIEYQYYESGHMVYAHQDSLKALHDNVAAFIGRTDNQSGS